jgi:hypothetical protein
VAGVVYVRHVYAGHEGGVWFNDGGFYDAGVVFSVEYVSSLHVCFAGGGFPLLSE